LLREQISGRAVFLAKKQPQLAGNFMLIQRDGQLWLPFERHQRARLQREWAIFSQKLTIGAKREAEMSSTYLNDIKMTSETVKAINDIRFPIT